MKTHLLIGLTLLTTLGCATARVSTEVQASSALPTAVAPADEMADDMAPTENGLQDWIPNIFADLWDVATADIGAGYGWGAHVKATNLARLGIFDYSDFSLIGVESDIFYGKWICPFCDESYEHCQWTGDVWDLSATVGVGFGMSVTLRPWEMIDLVSSIVGLGYWSLDHD